MSASSDTVNMALFCDFENVALGVRDAKYAKFDINKVLERLLLKGSIVLKKAYCDWERYKSSNPTCMKRRSSSSKSRMCACRERIRPTSVWWWMRWIFA